VRIQVSDLKYGRGSMVSLDLFKNLISDLVSDIQGMPLDSNLQSYLQQNYAADSPAFRAIRRACESGIDEGWICEREAGGIRYGRVLKPSDEWQGYSTDVVMMKNIKGPHHRHPKGEIDMIMPLSAGAEFDGNGEGWCVYPEESAHHPTVTGGESIILYLLPQGSIEFTK
jgi:hypothetical protein